MKADTDALPRLTTAQAAARLGVKSETIYAYVSRGILTSSRPDGARRGSTFDPLEVESLALRTRRPAALEASSIGTGSPLMVIDSGLTLIDGDELRFRGVDAVWLAGNASFETAATWLLTHRWDPDADLATQSADARTDRTRDQLFEHAMRRRWRDRVGLVDRLRIAVALASSADPLRDDLSPDAVAGIGLAVLPRLAGALSDRDLTPAASMAARVWQALTDTPADPLDLRALNAALVLLLDHDLASSTLAARVAASARANPYAVISAGLAGLEGVLHGAISARAHAMLAAVVDGARPDDVVGAILRAGQPIPGFGHRIYRARDPRSDALMSLLATGRRYRKAVDASRSLGALVGSRASTFANVDLALAVLTVGAGMPAEAGEAVFALARSAGWIAHAIEEYQCPPLRLRPTGRYIGPPSGALIEGGCTSRAAGGSVRPR